MAEEEENTVDLVRTLEEHRINTLQELRRVERLFAAIGSPELTAPMTTAWIYYVNSNMLLAELRQLTPNYPFSSHCLEEAKGRVYSDPNSNRSWNFCWLILQKIQSDSLIGYYAYYQASTAEMWASHSPTQEEIQALAEAFHSEWLAAVQQMLRHWENPPVGN